MGAETVSIMDARVNEMRELRAPSVTATLLFIGVLKVALEVAGFEWTWRWIQRRAERGRPLRDTDPAAVARAEYAVALAAALYPGRALCLERSLVLYHYLRRRGVPVRFRMGVQAYPFAAHAWVDLDGQPINDVPEHVRRFAPFAWEAP